jgi:hypothetical protein
MAALRALLPPLAALLLLPLVPASGYPVSVTKPYDAGAAGDALVVCDEDPLYATAQTPVGGACFPVDPARHAVVRLSVHDDSTLPTAAQYGFWSRAELSYVKTGWVCGVNSVSVPAGADFVRVMVAGPVGSALAATQVCPHTWVPGTLGTITAEYAFR